MQGLQTRDRGSDAQPDPRVNNTGMHGGGRLYEGQGPLAGGVGQISYVARLLEGSVGRDRGVGGELEGGVGQRHAGSLHPAAAAGAAAAGLVLSGGPDRFAALTPSGERQGRPAALGAAAALGVDVFPGQAGPPESAAASSGGSAGAAAGAGSEQALQASTAQEVRDGDVSAASSGARHGDGVAAAGRDSGEHATRSGSSSSGSSGGGGARQHIPSPVSSASLDSRAGDLPAAQPTGNLRAPAAASLRVQTRLGPAAEAAAGAVLPPPSAPSVPAPTAAALTPRPESQLGAAGGLGGASGPVEATVAPMDTTQGPLAPPVPVHTFLQPEADSVQGDLSDANVDLGLGLGLGPALGAPGISTTSRTPGGARGLGPVAQGGEIEPAEEQGMPPVGVWSGRADDGAFYAVDLRDANGALTPQQQRLPPQQQQQHSQQQQRQRASEPGTRGSAGSARSPHRRLWVGRPGQHTAPPAAATSAAVAAGGYGNAALAATAAAAAAWEQEWAGALAAAAALGSGGGAEGSPGASPGPSPRGWDWDGIVGRFAGGTQRR